MTHTFYGLEQDCEGIPMILRRVPDTAVQGFFRGLDQPGGTKRSDAIDVAITVIGLITRSGSHC